MSEPDDSIKSPYYPLTDDDGNLPQNEAEEEAYTDWLEEEGEDTSLR